MNHSIHLKQTLPLILLVFVVNSCVSVPRYLDLSRKTKYEVLEFPSLLTPNAYKEIIWPANQKVIAFIYENFAYIEKQPYVIEGEPTIRYLGLENDPACTLATHYILPTMLPDGRLGFTKSCVNGTRDPLSLGPAKTYLVAFDWQTRTVEQIVQEPLPHPNRSGCFSWNPQMTRAIQGTFDGLSGGLYWLTPSGSEAFNLVLHDGSRTWDVANSYVSLGNEKNDGIATCASWSPDADHIAFFATLKSIGLEGFARNNKPFDLYLYSFKTGKAETLLTEIYDPYNVQWSPDGKLIAFLGRMSNADHNDPNLWVFDPGTKQLFLIATGDLGHFGHFVWSPDIRDIAMIWCSDLLCTNSKDTQIRKYLIELP